MAYLDCGISLRLGLRIQWQSLPSGGQCDTNQMSSRIMLLCQNCELGLKLWSNIDTK